jgi:polyisoprenoid-binding protein YceI
LLLLLSPTGAGAEVWRSDPELSRLRFIATVEGAEAPGVFHRFQVRLKLGEPGGKDGQLTVEVDITSADMFSGELNEGIAEQEWFSFADRPSAVFTSEHIDAAGPDRFVATGTLQLKCASQTVRVPFSWNALQGRASLRGSLRLNRGDFCIGSGEWADDGAIGQTVEVAFDVALVPER